MATTIIQLAKRPFGSGGLVRYAEILYLSIEGDGDKKVVFAITNENFLSSITFFFQG